MIPNSKQAGSPANVSDVQWNGLRACLVGGDIKLPCDQGYDEARQVFNGMIDRRPAAIVRCSGTGDVAAAIDFSRRHHLPLSVRGGGHGISGHAVADGGLMIDCAAMKSVSVDLRRGTATAGSGLRLGEFIAAIERHGLVSPTGTASDTGIAGLTLGAGFGYLNGRFGLAVDNLVRAEVVLASGEVVHASETQHPDLFWAIRGGSGNFGVVTEFEFRTHAVPQVLGGMIIHPFSAAKEVFHAYREMANGAPDDLTIYAAVLTDPDGRQAIGIVPCWCGAVDQGEAALAPIRSLGKPLLDTVRWMPYSTMISMFDGGTPVGRRYYWKHRLMPTLGDEVIDIVIDFSSRVPSPLTAVVIDHVHGAARRVAAESMAFPHRNASHGILVLSGWEDEGDDGANVAWTRSFAEALLPWSTGGAYVNESWDEQAKSVYGQNWGRLREIKTRYDPANVFRLNSNIPPLESPEN